MACDDVAGPSGGAVVIWRVPSNAYNTPWVPAANADRSMVYFGTSDMRLRKIRGADGTVIWNVSTGAPIAVFPRMNAVLSGSVIALAKNDILAFDTTSGAPRWTYQAPDGEFTGVSALVANDSTVFSAGYSGRVHAVNAETGTARWITDLRDGNLDVKALGPSLHEDVVYVCTRDFNANPSTGALWALDAITGEVRWSYAFSPELPTQGSACYGPPAIAGQVVIQPIEDGRVFALDRATAAVKWVAPRVHNVSVSLQDVRYVSAGSAIALVTSDAVPGGIVAYDVASGTELWRRADNGGSLYPPVLDATTAYVDHGWVFASYDLATGATRWQTPQSQWHHPEAPYKGRPIVAGDRIYVAGYDGSYALRP